MNVLLLGPGSSRARIGGGPDFGESGEAVTVIDFDPGIFKHWSGAHHCEFDLRTVSASNPLPLPHRAFDEAHAYEVLNLLPGDEEDFFCLWGELWRVLKPGGRVFASTPHWQSRWVHAYPGQQRVYTPELLAYLDHGKHLTAKSDFDDLWPMPYNFVTVGAWDVCAMKDKAPQGFQFILEKA